MRKRKDWLQQWKGVVVNAPEPAKIAPTTMDELRWFTSNLRLVNLVEFCENSTIKQNSQFPCLPVLFWVSWTYCWCCSWWTAIWKFLCFESCGVFFFRKTRQYLITTTLLRGVFWFLLYFVLWAQEMKCSTYLLCIFRFSVESSLFVLFPQGFHT